MNQTLVDAHSHLQFPQYDADRDQVIARMRIAGVKTITVGVDVKTSVSAIMLAEKYPEDIRATVGIHPSELTTCDVVTIQEIKRLANHPKVVAIGECGLDYYRLQSAHREALADVPLCGTIAGKQIARQKEFFLQQIKIAEQVKKPLMVHCRPSQGTDDAYEDLIQEFSIINFQFPIIVHFFVGSPAIAQKLLMLGCYFTFGGVITFARDYDDAIRTIPFERILLETDAPYVAPEPHRGTRNEPQYVVEVATKLAEIINKPSEDIIKETTRTARKIFGI